MWKKYIQHLFGIDAKNKQKSLDISRKLSLLYAFLGWNCFGLAFFALLKDKIPQDKTERRKVYREIAGSPENLHVYEISGLKLTKEYDISLEEENSAKDGKEVAET